MFVYFNNDRGGAAVRDAEALTGMLARRGCRVARPAQADGAAGGVSERHVPPASHS